MALLLQANVIVQANITRERAFPDMLNPQDNERHYKNRSYCRLPRTCIFEVADLLKEDVERPTARSYFIPATLQAIIGNNCLPYKSDISISVLTNTLL
jgi:hypothetical protein